MGKPKMEARKRQPAACNEVHCQTDSAPHCMQLAAILQAL